MSLWLLSSLLLFAGFLPDFSSGNDCSCNAVLETRIKDLQIIKDLQNAVTNLQCRVTNAFSNKDASKNWFFKKSEVYKGKRYYFSQQDPISRSEEAMATCAFYGGYLVEIEDLDEFNFVINFIKQFVGFRLVLTGGTDEGAEEVWRYRQSNTVVPSFLVKSRKLGNQYNCLYLYVDETWHGVDDACYYTTAAHPTRFLCEIPEP